MREGAAVDGSIADSVQALTRATFGSGRLRVCGGAAVVLRWRDHAVAATATAMEPPADYAALAADTAGGAMDAGRGGGVGIYMDGQDGQDGGRGAGLTPWPPLQHLERGSLPSPRPSPTGRGGGGPRPGATHGPGLRPTPQ